MNKIIIAAMLLIAGLLMPSASTAGDGGRLRYKGFLGGMYVHAGYVPGSSFTVMSPDGLHRFDKHTSGLTTGIGGSIRLQFGDHLRVGGEGYSSTLKYDQFGSNVNVGWGGLLADCVWHLRGISPFAGVTVGGGTAKNLTLNAAAPLDFTTENYSSYRKYSFMVVAPFVGFEVSLNRRMVAVFKVDYMFDISSGQPDFPSGPRAYIGICFRRMK